ncbi:hypothetical protein SAMN05216175_103284 [Neptunomonas qingdaonensis]|uniref:Uncharacterized protein n=2 Tax=Neptunomonas qingdaonensis TaxID=1045558 RepID=A0A1I2P7K5_9GAMM|nr:hypothetical protein SAMN05216175_103284 [Neptunomonas qingdaonensis]
MRLCVFALFGALLTVPVYAQANSITPAICMAITDKMDRDRCILRYQSLEERKEQSDELRQDLGQKARVLQRQEQISSQRGYGMPRLEKYSGYAVKVVFDPVIHSQRIKCIGYDAQGEYVYSRSFYLRPPADHGIMKTRDARRITNILCN